MKYSLFSAKAIPSGSSGTYGEETPCFHNKRYGSVWRLIALRIGRGLGATCLIQRHEMDNEEQSICSECLFIDFNLRAENIQWPDIFHMTKSKVILHLVGLDLQNYVLWSILEGCRFLMLPNALLLCLFFFKIGYIIEFIQLTIHTNNKKALEFSNLQKYQILQFLWAV